MLLGPNPLVLEMVKICENNLTRICFLGINGYHTYICVGT